MYYVKSIISSKKDLIFHSLRQFHRHLDFIFNRNTSVAYQLEMNHQRNYEGNVWNRGNSLPRQLAPFLYPLCKESILRLTFFFSFLIPVTPEESYI